MSRWNSSRFVETVSSGGQTTVVKFHDSNPCWKKNWDKKNAFLLPDTYFLCNHPAQQLFSKLIFVRVQGWPSPFTSISTYNIRKGCGKSAVSKLGTSVSLESTLGSSAKVMSLPRWNVLKHPNRLLMSCPKYHPTCQYQPSVLSILSFQNLHMHQIVFKIKLFIELLSSVLICFCIYFFQFLCVSCSSPQPSKTTKIQPKLLAKTVGRLEVSCSQEVRQLSRPTYGEWLIGMDTVHIAFLGWIPPWVN